MATPQHNLIADRIKAIMDTMSAANGYNVDLVTASRVVIGWDQVGSSEFPFLGFLLGRSRYTHQGGNIVRTVMPVHFVGHVSTSTATERSDEINDLMDDVWKLCNDSLLNGGGSNAVAISTKVIESATDEGDPDTMDHNGGTGSFEMVAEIAFERTTGGT